MIDLILKMSIGTRTFQKLSVVTSIGKKFCLNIEYGNGDALAEQMQQA